MVALPSDLYTIPLEEIHNGFPYMGGLVYHSGHTCVRRNSSKQLTRLHALPLPTKTMAFSMIILGLTYDGTKALSKLPLSSYRSQAGLRLELIISGVARSALLLMQRSK